MIKEKVRWFISSEGIKEAIVLLLISVLIWITGTKLYDNKVTPILILLAIIGYKFLKLGIDIDKNLSLKCWITSSILAFFEVYGETIRPYIYQNVHLGILEILKIVILSIILAIIIAPILFYLATHIQINNEVEKFDKTYLIINWILIVMIYGIGWIGFYPGMIAYSTKLEQNIEMSNSLLYTIILKGIGLITNDTRSTMVIFNIIQIGMVTFSIILGISYLKKLKVPKLVRVIALDYYMLLPAYILMSICITKYVILGSIGLINIILVSEMIRTRKISYTKLMSIGLIGSLIDTNYLYMLLITSLIVIKLEKGKYIKKLLLSIGLISIMTFGLNGIANIDNGILDKMIDIPCQQIARTCRYNKVPNLEKYKTLDSVLPLYYSSDYNVLSIESIKNKADKGKLADNKLKFIKEYMSLGLKYPSEYFEAYFLKNIGIWYSNEKTTYNIDLLDLYYYTISEDDTVRKVINSYYSMFDLETVYEHAGVFKKLFYIGSYTWATILCLIGMIFKNKKEYLVLPIMLLSYMLAISFDASVNIHNTFIVMMCTPYLVCLTLSGLKDKGTEDEVEDVIKIKKKKKRIDKV